MTRDLAGFIICKREIRLIFSVIRESIVFVLEKTYYQDLLEKFDYYFVRNFNHEAAVYKEIMKK